MYDRICIDVGRCYSLTLLLTTIRHDTLIVFFVYTYPSQRTYFYAISS